MMVSRLRAYVLDREEKFKRELAEPGYYAPHQLLLPLRIGKREIVCCGDRGRNVELKKTEFHGHGHFCFVIFHS